MKKIYLFFLLNLFAFKAIMAQGPPTLATQYFFKTKTNVELENMAGAVTLIGAVRADDQVSEETPITFPFEFVSKQFTTFRVFSSGALVLFPAATTAQEFQVLLPWSDAAFVTGDNGHISYKVIGTENRKLVVEYFLADFVANSQFPAIADKKFQLWLYENSNQIQFVYSDGVVGKFKPVVGISGSDAQGDLLQIDTDLHQVTSNSSYLSPNWPGYGRSYVFSPQAFTAVDPSASISSLSSTSVCEGYSAMLSATLNDAEATGYQWLKDGIIIPNATNNTYAAASTGKYTVQISYADGIVSSSYINVFVADLQADVNTTSISCNATGNGSISIVNARGSNNIFEYSLNNGARQSSEVFSDLLPGSYSVQLHSGNCTKDLGSFVIKDLRVSPTVTILQSSGGACANITLTANPANALSYQWSNGETSPSITLDNNNNDGKYSVTVSNGVGCSGSASYTYNKQNQLNSYVLLASKALSLGENNTVNGAVGNTGNLPVYINKNSVINSFVRSLAVKLNDGATVTGAITYQAPQVSLPTVYTNTSVVNNLPVHVTADNFAGTLNGNYSKLTIGKKAQVILAGHTYGKVTVKEGAQVTFTSADVSIDMLETEDGYKNSTIISYTSLTFAPNSIIRIKEKVSIGKRNTVNAAGSTFYLADLRNDVEKFVLDGASTEFNGNVYAPAGRITVKNGDQLAPCTMNGIFIGESIVSDKYVNWNRNTCNIFAPRVANSLPLYGSKSIDVKVFPNPALGKFNLVVKTATATNAQVIVMNVHGVTVKTENFKNVVNGRNLAINLSNQPAGTYLVKVITLQGTQTLKVIVK